jgi:hypothetical protein
MPATKIKERAVSCRTISRRRHAVESFASAADCIGPLEHGMSLFAITRGQFSMLDAINAVIDQIPSASVSVWTWAIADYEVECMESFMASKKITSGTLVIDRGGEQRNPATIQKWRDKFGASNVRVCLNHAKIARVWNDDYHVLLRGSMNLNFNPRFEQLDITEGGADFDLVSEIENALPVLPISYTHEEAVAASQLGLAFEASELKMFEGIKKWKK